MNITSENAALYAAIAAEITKQVEVLQTAEPQTTAKIWPMSVKDLPLTETYWVDNSGIITTYLNFSGCAGNEMPTHAAAESALAFMQLSRIVYYLNDGDVYEADNNNWFTIKAFNNILSDDIWQKSSILPRILYFKNEKDRNRSMIDHRELWEKYFMI